MVTPPAKFSNYSLSHQVPTQPLPYQVGLQQIPYQPHVQGYSPNIYSQYPKNICNSTQMVSPYSAINPNFVNNLGPIVQNNLQYNNSNFLRQV